MSTDQVSSAEHPWPVRTVARKVAAWIDRLGAVWVEGQLTQVNARPGTGTAFLVLRDPAVDVSLTLTCPIALVRSAEVPVVEGSRVIVHGKPTFFLGRGTFSLILFLGRVPGRPPVRQSVGRQHRLTRQRPHLPVHRPGEPRTTAGTAGDGAACPAGPGRPASAALGRCFSPA